MRVFNIDITRKGISPVVQVTEYDAMSRFFTLVLRNGSSDYEPPENPNYSVWYKTKDSTGWYDTITLPDESTRPAVVADGNAFTIEIAEQATTSCGELALMINGDDGYQLTVSGIITRSDDIPGYDGQEVENYYNVFITRMQENAARAENAADIAVAYGATVEVDEEAQQLNITHHSDTEGGVGWLFGSAVTSSASGSVAAFPDGADDVAIKSLVAEITPVQSGSGDPSPTNVRAISGRTGLTVTHANKNLMPNMAGTNSTTSNDITFAYNNDGSVTLNGTATSTAFSKGVEGLNYRIYLPHGIYKKPVMQIDASHSVGLYVQYVRSESDWVLVTGGGRESTSFTIDDDYPVVIRVAVQNGTSVNNVRFEPYIYPDSVNDLTWVSPVKNTYPISWQTQAGTVYGGTLNVTTGVLTVNGVLHTLTGNENFSLATNSRRFQKAFATLEWERANTLISTQNQSNSVCSHATYLTGATGTATPADYRISNDSSNAQALVFYDTQTVYANATAFNAYLAGQYANGTPVQLYYDLATPLVPIQLSPTEVKTLLGGNTIYTDAGSVSVEYVADTKLYIDGKVAELQALILEN